MEKRGPGNVLTGNKPSLFFGLDDIYKVPFVQVHGRTKGKSIGQEGRAISVHIVYFYIMMTVNQLQNE